MFIKIFFFFNIYRDSFFEFDFENYEYCWKRLYDNMDYYIKGKLLVFNKLLNKMRILKILIEESDEVEE